MRLVTPGAGHAAIAAELDAIPGLRSDDVPDVEIAALAIEHGLVLASHDHAAAVSRACGFLAPLTADADTADDLRTFDTMGTADGRTTPRELLREHRATILSLLSQRGGQGVRIFGSLARGDDDARSDIDLLMELPDAGSMANELLTVLGLSEELSELVGARIDIVTPRTMRDEVREAALAEAVPL